MTEQDELSRLARAITEAEDELNTSNHRDDCQQLAQIDEQRTAIVDRIESREKALEDARAAMLDYADRPSMTAPPVATSAYAESLTDVRSWHVTEPAFTNGQGHQED